MLKLFIFFSLFISSTLSAIAGDKGNFYAPSGFAFYGGDAVVCRDSRDQIKKAYLLDYAEKERLFPDYKIKMSRSTLEYAGTIATRLERQYPDTFIAFRRELMKLVENFEAFAKNNPLPRNSVVEFVKDLSLLNIKDSYHKEVIGTNIKGCNVEQVVIRQKTYKGVSYLVQADIFRSLSETDRFGLALHEAIYHSFNMYYGDQSSARSRFFNRCIMRLPLHKLTTKQIEWCAQNAFIWY